MSDHQLIPVSAPFASKYSGTTRCPVCRQHIQKGEIIERISPGATWTKANEGLHGLYLTTYRSDYGHSDCIEQYNTRNQP